MGGTPTGDLLGTALVLSVGLVALTLVLPGAGPVPTTAALLVFAFGTGLAVRAVQRGFPYGRLGLCNVTTLARLALATALVAPLVAGADASWPVLIVAVVALALDGVDGWLARWQGYASDFGARFDMEVDSALALILALAASMASGAGALAIILGLPRYLFFAAAHAFPWMQRDLPERFSRKGVCVLQLGTLIALQAPILPGWLAVWLVLVAALALVWSFAVDLVWLWRRRG
jgi:phosphatidylglycerophosphate synthase